MSYAKEYDEALSRLNAPERSPLPYAPIPYGPVPNYCNYANWNRIMFETRQGNLPKYSIMQRCSFDEQNFLSGNSYSDSYYVYKLDPLFAFAKGDRKSIAIREISVHPPLSETQNNVLLHFSFVMDIAFDDGDMFNYNPDGTATINVNVRLEKDVQITMQLLADRVAQELLNRLAVVPEIVDADTTLADKLSDIRGEFNYITGDLKIIILFDPGDTIDLALTEVLLNQQTFRRNTVFEEYINSANRSMNPSDITFGQITEHGREHRTIEITWHITDNIINYQYGTLCSTINPWTPKNVVGGYNLKSDSLTKLYPYNGTDEIRFWFLDVNGNPIKYHYARGYVDLELIVDNSNSFAMDA